MNRLYKLFSLTLLAFFINTLTGCASSGPNAMMDYAPVNQLKADSNYATITFVKNSLMPSFFGTPVGIYKKDKDSVDYVGHVDNGTRVSIKLKPGHHEFVLLGEIDNIVLADVKANLNYFVDIRRGISFLAETFHGVALNAEDLSDVGVQGNIRRADNAIISKEGKAWFETKRAEFTRRYKNARKSFNVDGIIDKYAIVHANYGIEYSFY